MIPLVRGAEPAILAEKGAAWTQKHLADRARDPKKRPNHRCYGHEAVRVELRRMSARKCFYCERRLADSEQEVDHYIEAAEQPQHAFTWSNLYLSCESCNNGKAPNTSHPVTACLDPCAPGVDPGAHLTFQAECIEPLGESTAGRNTIRKYNLDRDGLDLARARALGELRDAIIVVQRSMIADGRRALSEAERGLLRQFGDPIRPFSLMMKTYLDRMGL